MKEVIDVTIRIATVEDAERLSAFAARTFAETFASENTPEDMATYLAETFTPDRQRVELIDAGTRVVLGELRGACDGERTDERRNELVAYAQIAAHDAPECVSGPAPIELVRFYVDRAGHGRGIAQAMMQRAIDEAIRMGGRTLWLGVWERNPRAIAFYRKMGFHDVGAHDFTLGRDVQTDRVMQRAIGGDGKRADG